MISAPLHDTFLVHQARIHGQLTYAEGLLRVGDDEAVASLGRARWMLIRLLREYQLFKHNRIFDPAIRGTNCEFAAAARDMKVSCIQAGDDFIAYTKRWGSVSVKDNWTEYHLAATAMVAKLREHLGIEQQAVSHFLR